MRTARPVQHAEPCALTAIAAWSAYQRDAGRSIQIHDSVKSPYTWRFGLLSALTGSTENSARATRFLPPTQIASESSIPTVLERTVDLLGLTSLGSRAGIAKSISEAVRNVFEHAKARDGAFLYASYFQATDRLSIAVADTGVGVPATIRPRYGAQLSDADANQLATELKVTGAPLRGDMAGPLATPASAYITCAPLALGAKVSLLSCRGLPQCVMTATACRPSQAQPELIGKVPWSPSPCRRRVLTRLLTLHTRF